MTHNEEEFKENLNNIIKGTDYTIEDTQERYSTLRDVPKGRSIKNGKPHNSKKNAKAKYKHPTTDRQKRRTKEATTRIRREESRI
ncbi:hypothetical protein C0J52_15061 [Blattella germanica]|nr:hypothetical protein C0J52_15061 [Blattella germanica]